MLCWVMWSINNQQLARLHLSLSLFFSFFLSLPFFCVSVKWDRQDDLATRKARGACASQGSGLDMSGSWSHNKPVSLSVNNISSDCVSPLAWPADWSVRRMSSAKSVSCFLAWGGVIGCEGPEVGVSPHHCPQCPWVGVVVEDPCSVEGRRR